MSAPTLTMALTGATASLGGRIVLDGVNLSVAPGELVAVVGPNGAGKSSAIRALAGLLPADRRPRPAGRRRRGRPVAARAGQSGPPICRRNAASPGTCRRSRWPRWARLSCRRRGGVARRRPLSMRSRPAHLADRGVAEMSGGERARVLLARALATERARPAGRRTDRRAGSRRPADGAGAASGARAGRAGGSGQPARPDPGGAVRRPGRGAGRARVVADAAPMEALSPEVMARVFGLTARWVAGPDGPLLAAGRRQFGRIGRRASNPSPAHRRCTACGPRGRAAPQVFRQASAALIRRSAGRDKPACFP